MDAALQSGRHVVGGTIAIDRRSVAAAGAGAAQVHAVTGRPSRSKRASNLQAAFHVSQQRRPFVEGRRILLVDDVMTTGATANACARTLLVAGAVNVDVLVFARVVMAD